MHLDNLASYFFISGVKTELIKVALPAIDRVFWFHLDNLASYFFISGPHTIQLDGLAPIGIPK